MIQPVTNNATSPQVIEQNMESNKQNVIIPRPIIPARGWIKNEQGKVVLVDYDPNDINDPRAREILGTCNRK